jgi:hypothetical protein
VEPHRLHEQQRQAQLIFGFSLPLMGVQLTLAQSQWPILQLN